MEARSIAKYVKMSSSKVKPVADLVRGKNLSEALTILKFTPGKGAELVEKVVQSAAANAEKQPRDGRFQAVRCRNIRKPRPDIKAF